jgi:hypothetical protein
MTFRMSIMTGAALMVAPFLCAEPMPESLLADHDVVILGEVHDNQAHHAVQARLVEELEAAAVVFEMLTPEEAQALSDVSRDAAAMIAAVGGFHWANIADYAEILAASPVIIGAAPDRDSVRAAFSDGAAVTFGPDAEIYGLDQALDDAEQERREALQYDAHCEAMPAEMMGGMVEAQRLRDAAFARAVIAAFDRYGAPIVLITGNGHARTDWGVPVYLARARPELSVLALGQGEAGAAPGGDFDVVLTDAPPAERPDPCDAFN